MEAQLTRKADAVDVRSDTLTRFKALIADDFLQEGAVEVEEAVVDLGGRATAGQDANGEGEDAFRIVSVHFDQGVLRH